MMLTQLQKKVLATIAKLRHERSDVAGGVVLNANRPSISDDIDIFHYTEQEVVATARKDIAALREAAFSVREELMQFGLVEVLVREGSDETLIQWMEETVRRFFPLQRDPSSGFACMMRILQSTRPSPRRAGGK